VASGERDQGGLRVAGLFAGIGGIELGLDDAGHGTTFPCDFEPGHLCLRR
jgi:site-specific DNA-cytosine methylase